jgi:hypothetical protein
VDHESQLADGSDEAATIVGILGRKHVDVLSRARKRNIWNRNVLRFMLLLNTCKNSMQVNGKHTADVCTLRLLAKRQVIRRSA